MFHMPKMNLAYGQSAQLVVDGPSGRREYRLDEVMFHNTGSGAMVSGGIVYDSFKPYPQPTNRTNFVANPWSKGTAVANTYDKQDDKNTAIGQVSISINKLEAALFTRNRRMAEVEREQDGLVMQASFNLDAALAQALQEGVTVEDLEQHFPEHSDVLENRVDGIVQITTLDTIDVLV